MAKELFLPFRILAAVNVETSDGQYYCHVIVDDSVATTLIQAGAIDDWANVPESYKTESGQPQHEYLGKDVTKSLVTTLPKE